MAESPEVTARPAADAARSDTPAGRLWDLWRRGQGPDVRSFLAGFAGLAASQVAEVLRVDQRERWRIGQRVTAVAYLRDHPDLESDVEAALDLVYGEFLLREELGESPTLAEFLQEYPRYAARLRVQVEVHRALGSGPSRDLDGTTLPTLGISGSPASDAASAPRAGGAWPAVVGYEVIGELGRGGMGVVYKARHLKLDRIVALKMILAGEHAGLKERDRFQAEAEAVACLQHPNVVQIFEVGEQAGLPYLALELVEGGSLARRLDATPMRARPAAALIETLARAVHAAHERGIVHRDLKPANVLLTADGIPKIADFGLAKRLRGGGGPSESGSILGTPGFMAPEQAAGRAGEIGPPADVHALGAILYTMMTGHPPFQAATPLEVIEQVRSAEPVRPRRLQPRLPRDLETICLKCLRKDPRRRYASARALADDLRRFLDGKPILARPVDPAERLGRWCLREPKVASLLALLALAIVAGFALVTRQWQRAEDQTDFARRERNEAIRERLRAETNFQRARDAVNRLTELGGRMVNLPRMDRTARAVLEESLAFYQTFLREKSTDPGIRREAASACIRVGRIRHLLGQLEESEVAYRQGADLLDGLSAESPTNAAYRHELVQCHRDWGHLLRDMGSGKSQQTLDAYDRAITLGERLLIDAPTVAAYQSTVANTLTNRCVVLNRLGRFGEAEETFGRAIDLQRGALATAPRNVGYREELALSLDDLGALLWERGRPREAEDACRQGLDLRQELSDEGPRPTGFRSYLARSYWRLGRILAGTDRPDEAEPAYRRAALLMDGLVADSPDVPYHRSQLVNTLADLAALLDAPERLPEAEEVHRRILAHGKKLVADFPEEPDYRRDLADRHQILGRLLRAADRHADAAEELRRALTEQPNDAAANNTLAWILATSPDPSHRDPVQALGLAKKAVDGVPGNGNFWNTLGVAHYRDGDYPASIAALNKAMDLRSGGDAFDWIFLAMAHRQLGDMASAGRFYDRAIRWVEENRPVDAEISRFRTEAEALLSSEEGPDATIVSPRSK